MADNAHILDELDALALSILEPEEVTRVKDHLAGCLICRNELAARKNVTAQLAYAIPPRIPPAHLKAQLMDRLQAAKPQPRSHAPVPSRPWFERLLPAWGLASLILIIALAALNLLLWQRFNAIDFLVSSGGLKAVPLSPGEATSSATGFVLVSADGEDGALVVDGLPPLQENQQYQLWLMREGEKVSGAVFSTDEHSYGGTRIRAPRSLLEYSAAEVTIEPEGGSPQPTGIQVLSGSLHNP